jgi:hypothetical protein
MIHLQIATVILCVASVLDSRIPSHAYNLVDDLVETEAGAPAYPVMACPLCGQEVPTPEPSHDGSPVLAECDDCDIYFDVPSSRRRQMPNPGS